MTDSTQSSHMPFSHRNMIMQKMYTFQIPTREKRFILSFNISQRVGGRVNLGTTYTLRQRCARCLQGCALQ